MAFVSADTNLRERRPCWLCGTAVEHRVVTWRSRWDGGAMERGRMYLADEPHRAPCGGPCDYCPPPEGTPPRARRHRHGCRAPACRERKTGLASGGGTL